MPSQRMMQPSQDYPEMYQLIAGWFHQDFRIAGNTFEEVVASYKRDCSPEYWREARSDILRFVRERDDAQVKDGFQQFDPGVDPEAWDMSIRQWLLRIAELLQ